MRQGSKIVSDDLEGGREEAIVTYVKLLFQHSPSEDEEVRENLSVISKSLGDVEQGTARTM
jgi:hypothetical protein